MAKNGNIHPTRIFRTESDLLKAWNEYKEYLKEESIKWEKVQYVGKDGNKVKDYPKLPLTMEGFEVFCYDRYGTVKHYFDNKDKLYNEFGAICSRIRTEIRADQIAGGLLGFYNPSITQRLNNLKETTEQNINHSLPILNLDPLDDSIDNQPKKDK
jgi:hypothetical protein